MRERAEHRVAAERRQRVLRAEQRERLALAQIQQARGLIDLAAGQHHGLDRAAAQASRGCSAGVAASCARRSGEALSSVQRSPSAETARLAWVRGVTRGSPSHASGTPHSGNSIAENRHRPRTQHNGGEAAHADPSGGARAQYQEV